MVVPCEMVVVWWGELDSSESRQYITPLCETWMLGAQPIPFPSRPPSRLHRGLLPLRSHLPARAAGPPPLRCAPRARRRHRRLPPPLALPRPLPPLRRLPVTPPTPRAASGVPGPVNTLPLLGSVLGSTCDHRDVSTWGGREEEDEDEKDEKEDEEKDHCRCFSLLATQAASRMGNITHTHIYTKKPQLC